MMRRFFQYHVAAMTRDLQHMHNLRQIFLNSVESVRPAQLLTELNNYALKPKLTEDQRLLINVQGKSLDITTKRCHLVGFGKAVLGMAVQLERALDKRLTQGILSIPVGSQERFQNQAEMQLRSDTCITVLEGALHNQPDDAALEAAKRIKQLASQMRADDVLFVLISGGGSALLPLPKPPLSLTEKMQLVRQLANCGASIDEMNLVRIALSDIKGGRLAVAAKHASAKMSFVISDIVNDPVGLIASGPTCCTVNKKFTAQQVLQKYAMWSTLPAHIMKVIELAQTPEDDVTPGANNAIYVVGDNRVATATALAQSLQCGYNPFIASTSVQGQLQHLVDTYVELLRNIRCFQRGEIEEYELKARFPFDSRIFQHFLKTLLMCQKTQKPLLLILAGEPTVKVTGTGLGGRNQELALRMALALYENPDFKDIVFLSAGTDGIDGPTPAAGALGSHSIIEQYLLAEPDKPAGFEKLRAFLQNNDSYNFYRALNAGEFHVVTGHTGTNVMDLQLLLVP